MTRSPFDHVYGHFLCHEVREAARLEEMAKRGSFVTLEKRARCFRRRERKCGMCGTVRTLVSFPTLLRANRWHI